jgi:hydroxymethylpyrimidine kinase/phosphomethylpyrimidine kinase
MDGFVVCLSGWDPSGHAGLARDLATLQRFGRVGTGVPTCLTVQSRKRFDSVRGVDPEWVSEALARLADEGWPAAVKVGLVTEVEVWNAIGAWLGPVRERGIPVVVDPVRAPTHGGWQATGELRAWLRDELLPLGPHLTPNRPELEWLSESGPSELIEGGAHGVLVTGGHEIEAGDSVVDRWWDTDGERILRRPRLPGPARRGTGCALSTLLAANLAAATDGFEAARVSGHMLSRIWTELTPAD